MTGRRTPTPWLGRAAAAVMLAFAVLIGAAPAAGAHALAQSSDPAAGSTLTAAPEAVTIVFGERPDPHLSSIRVLDTSGAEHQKGSTEAVAGRPTALTVHAGPLTKGVYTVSWRTVSEVDGHLATGSFAFGVDVAPGADAASSGTVRSPGAPGVAVVARWLFAAGVMVLFGTVVVSLLAGGLLPGRARLAVVGAWVTVAAGIVMGAEQQRRAAGLALRSLFGSSLGHQTLDRAVPAAAALVALIAVVVLPWRRVLLCALAAATAATMVGDVLASHAAAANTLRAWRIADQAAHLAAVSAWLGGLAALVIVLPALPEERRERTGRRFSTLAAVMLAAVAATGVQRAMDEVGSWSALIHTGFGRWVLLKGGILVALGVLGALNRYRAIPGLPARIGLLRKVGMAEVTLAGVALVATGFLQSLAPPSTIKAAPKPHPVVVFGHDFGTSVKVRLSVSPGTAGFNTFIAAVTDYDTGKPADAAVSLRFALPARPDLGGSTLPMERRPDGGYTAKGANLSVDGTWTVTVLAQRGADSVEVPLTVATRQPPEKIDVSRNPGLPTIYTAHLSAGRSAQLYLDPGHPGTINEFHFTPIGADGNEFPVAEFAAAAQGPSGPAVPLVVRRLDPIGHFVADLPNAPKGRYHFDVTATTPTGERIHITLTIPVA